LPKEKAVGRKSTISRREILNAILYRVKTGCQWRALPHDLPNYHTVYSYFTWWTIDGTLEAMMTALRETVRTEAGREPTPSAGIIDSQSVKTTAYGGEEGTIGVDGHKKVNGRKRHILVDTMGLLLAVVVTAANLPDREGARRLGSVCSEFPRLCKIWVDGSYTGDVKDFYLNTYAIDFEIVDKPAGQKGFVVSPVRWVVERSLSWFGWYRGLSRDYEYCPRHSESMIKLAQIQLMLRRLTRPSKT
jgi:putative transposase